MAEEERELDRRALARELMRCAGRQGGGTLLVRGGANQLGGFGLRGGELVSLVFGGMSGQRALCRLLDLRVVTVRFDPGTVLGDGGDRPDCTLSDVLEALAPGTPTGLLVNNENSPGRRVIGAVDEETLAALGDLAGEVLGPMGPLMFDAMLQKTGPTPGGVLAAAAALARDLRDPEAAGKFIARVSEHLGVDA